MSGINFISGYSGPTNLNDRTKWGNKRPLLDKKNNQSKINRLYSQRKNIYKLANHRVDCKNLDKESIAKKVIIFYEEY